MRRWHGRAARAQNWSSLLFPLNFVSSNWIEKRIRSKRLKLHIWIDWKGISMKFLCVINSISLSYHRRLVVENVHYTAMKLERVIRKIYIYTESHRRRDSRLNSTNGRTRSPKGWGIPTTKNSARTAKRNSNKESSVRIRKGNVRNKKGQRKDNKKKEFQYHR